MAVLASPDKAAIAHKARDLLSVFPTVPGANALMSAAFAAHIERDLDLPVQIVAGTLSVEGSPVLRDGGPFDRSAVFASSNPDWDGHVWVMVGQFVADISIFRTAYSADCQPRLGRHIVHTFGGGKGLYFDGWRHTRKLYLSYDPHYVLSTAEVTGLVRRRPCGDRREGCLTGGHSGVAEIGPQRLDLALILRQVMRSERIKIRD